MTTGIDALAVALVAWIAVEDIARFRIRNSLVALLAVLYGLRILVGGSGSDLIWHGVFAAAILVAMFAVFALGGTGAGDAKLMTAGCLWIGPDRSLVFALVLLVTVLISCVCAKLRWLPTRRDGVRIKIPFGPSIAVSWIATMITLPLD